MASNLKRVLVLILLGLVVFSIIPVNGVEQLISSNTLVAGLTATLEDGPYPSGCTNILFQCGSSEGFSTGGSGWFLLSAKLSLSKSGTLPSGSVIAHIYNANTQTLASAIPDGTIPLEASNGLDFSVITTSEIVYQFNFTGNTKLSSNRVYVIAIVSQNTTSFGASFIGVVRSTTGGGATGLYDDSSWRVTSGDMFYELYGIPTPQSSFRDASFYGALVTGTVGALALAVSFFEPSKKDKPLFKAAVSLILVSFILFLTAGLF